jgi:hypothetical protein
VKEKKKISEGGEEYSDEDSLHSDDESEELELVTKSGTFGKKTLMASLCPGRRSPTSDPDAQGPSQLSLMLPGSSPGKDGTHALGMSGLLGMAPGSPDNKRGSGSANFSAHLSQEKAKDTAAARVRFLEDPNDPRSGQDPDWPFKIEKCAAHMLPPPQWSHSQMMTPDERHDLQLADMILRAATVLNAIAAVLVMPVETTSAVVLNGDKGSSLTIGEEGGLLHQLLPNLICWPLNLLVFSLFIFFLIPVIARFIELSCASLRRFFVRRELLMRRRREINCRRLYDAACRGDLMEVRHLVCDMAGLADAPGIHWHNRRFGFKGGPGWVKPELAHGSSAWTAPEGKPKEEKRTNIVLTQHEASMMSAQHLEQTDDISGPAPLELMAGRRGWTAVHAAAYHGRYEVLDFLCMHGGLESEIHRHQGHREHEHHHEGGGNDHAQIVPYDPAAAEEDAAATAEAVAQSLLAPRESKMKMSRRSRLEADAANGLVEVDPGGLTLNWIVHWLGGVRVGDDGEHADEWSGDEDEFDDEAKQKKAKEKKKKDEKKKKKKEDNSHMRRAEESPLHLAYMNGCGRCAELLEDLGLDKTQTKRCQITPFDEQPPYEKELTPLGCLHECVTTALIRCAGSIQEVGTRGGVGATDDDGERAGDIAWVMSHIRPRQIDPKWYSVLASRRLWRGCAALMDSLEDEQIGFEHCWRMDDSGILNLVRQTSAFKFIGLIGTNVSFGCLQALAMRHEHMAALPLGLLLSCDEYNSVESKYNATGTISFRYNVELKDIYCAGIARLFPHTRTIALTRCVNLGDAGVLQIAKGCTRLKRVSIGQCPLLTDDAVGAIAEHCPDLTDLDLESLVNVTDTSLYSLASFSPKLENLNLQECELVTENGLDVLFKKCKLLTISSVRGVKRALITDHMVHTVCDHRRFDHSFHTLDLFGCCNVTNDGLESLRHLNKLETVSLHGCSNISDKGLQLLARNNPHIRSLNLTGCKKVTSKGLLELAKACHGITLPRLIGVTKWRLTDAVLYWLALNNRTAKTMDLSYCYELTDDGLTDLSKACKVLEEVNLIGCGKVSHMGLENMVKNCEAMTIRSLDHCRADLLSEAVIKQMVKNQPWLTHVDLSSCSWITNETLKLVCSKYVMLTHIVLAGLTEIGDSGVMALADSCRQLEHVDLNGCAMVGDRALIALVLRCLKLKSLQCRGVEKLSKIFLRTVSDSKKCNANLTSLDLSGCHRVANESMIPLATKCRKIKELRLAQCWQLSDASIRNCGMYLRDLEVLELECDRQEQVTDNSINIVGVHCSQLRVLNLNGCVNVTDAPIARFGQNCEERRVKKIADAQYNDRKAKLKPWEMQEEKRKQEAALARLPVAEQAAAMKLQAAKDAMPDDDDGNGVDDEDEVELHLNGLLKLTDEGLSIASKGCMRNLTILHLRGCVGLTDAALEQVGGYCASISDLDLGGCAQITDVGMIALLEGPNGKVGKLVKFNIAEKLKRSSAGRKKSMLAHKAAMDAAKGKKVNGNKVKGNKVKGLLKNGRRASAARGAAKKKEAQVKIVYGKAGGCSGHLKVLLVDGCDKVTNDFTDAVWELCVRLKTIDIEGCVHITKKALVRLVEKCQSLTVEELRGVEARLITNHALEPLGMRWKHGTAAAEKVEENDQAKDEAAHAEGGVDKQAATGFAAVAAGPNSSKSRGAIITDSSGDGPKSTSVRKGRKNSQMMKRDAVEVREVKSANDDEDPAVSAKDQTKGAGGNLDLSRCKWVNGSSLVRVMEEFRGVTALCLKGCRNVTDDAVRQVALKCELLVLLDLSHCDKVTDRSLVSIAHSCTLLEQIVLTGCHQVTSAGLTVLLHDCPEMVLSGIVGCAPHVFTDDMIVNVVNNNPLLREIDVSYMHALTDRSLIKMSRGCRRLKRLVMKGTPRFTANGLVQVLKGCHYLNLQNVDGYPPEIVTDQAVVFSVKNDPHVLEIDLDQCRLVTDAALLAIAAACKCLTKVKLHEVRSISAAGIMALLSDVPTLGFEGLDGVARELLNDEVVTLLVDNDPKATKLMLRDCCTITDPTMIHMAKFCKQLLHLDLANCTEISDHAVATIVKSCKQLECIDLEGLVKLSDSSLRAIAAAPCVLHLRELNVRNCHRLTGKAMANLMDKAQNIDLNGLKGVPPSAFTVEVVEALVRNHPSYATELRLEACSWFDSNAMKIVAKSRKMERLRTLSLASCPMVSDAGMVDVCKHLVSLTHLDLSRCWKLSDTTGKLIADHLINLKCLSLSYCNRISDVTLKSLALSCKTLTSLDLSHCVRVTMSEVERTTIRLPRCRVMMRHIMGKAQRKKLAALAMERAQFDADGVVPDEAIIDDE